ncbi:hypothetical protein O0L34_g16902 [Tuta absoluta]|nr:hypothetical protein O0L34_g16902 [Tuta absoluta]
MAPKKTKTGDSETERLVNVISNLETVIMGLQEKLDECFVMITSQQRLLTSTNNNVEEIRTIIINDSPKYSEVLKIPQRFQHINNVTSLNESGPQGLGFIGKLNTSKEEEDQTTTYTMSSPNPAADTDKHLGPMTSPSRAQKVVVPPVTPAAPAPGLRGPPPARRTRSHRECCRGISNSTESSKEGRCW